MSSRPPSTAPNTTAVRHQELEEDDGYESDEEKNIEDPEEEFWDALSITEDEEVVEKDT